MSDQNPTSINSILLPLELNHPDDETNMVRYGSKLAMEQNMELILASLKRSSVLKKYQEIIQEITGSKPGVNFKILKKKNADKMTEYLEEHNIKLIILSSKNLKEQPRISVKNISGRLLNNSHVPVLVYPTGGRYATVRKILYGTDFHPFDIEVMKKLSELFDETKPEITALHITRDLNFDKKLKQAGYLKTIKSKIDNPNLKINILVTREETSIPNSIRTLAIGEDADLIAILQEQTNFIGSAIKESITNDLATNSEIPLMVFSVA